MKFFKKMYTNFRSIFISEDILKENEKHANIVTASTMLNLFWISLIACALTYFNVFKIGLPIMNGVVGIAFLLLVIPAIICYIAKGKGEWIKHILFISFIIAVAIADAWLKYNVTLFMVLPVVLAARYYNKRFTLATAIATTIVFTISAWIGVYVGEKDLNIYNPLLNKETNITINTTIKAEVSKLDVDSASIIKNTFVQFLLPKVLIYNIVAFACVQISQSGKKMIRKQKEIAKKDARIETELNLANAIQKNMLPSTFPPFPEHKELDIYAQMTPAKEVGGDFYDMFLIDNNHLAICMADVSGKGVPAALFMMITKILIKNVSSIDKETNKALTRVNNMLCDGNKTGIFVTAWFGILDLTTGYLEYTNAGHNPPLLYSKKTGKFEFLNIKPNMVLAGMENVNYRKNEIQMESGDRIFLYTDGVTEATNAENKLYGGNRLHALLNHNINLSVTETIKKVKNDIDEFMGNAEQFDDITMLELLYRGKNIRQTNLIQRKFKADTKEIPAIQQFAEIELEKYKCNTKIIYQINLVIEEVFVNIANYAYKDKEGYCTLSIEIENNKVILTFEDSGIPFNPLEKSDPDISLPAKKRAVGGLGIFLTKRIMDEVKYKYENNKNILRITKDLNKE